MPAPATPTRPGIHRQNHRNDPLRRVAAMIVDMAHRTQTDPGVLLAGCVTRWVGGPMEMLKQGIRAASGPGTQSGFDSGRPDKPELIAIESMEAQIGLIVDSLEDCCWSDHAPGSPDCGGIQAGNEAIGTRTNALGSTSTQRALGVGRLYECMLAVRAAERAGERRRLGAFYTPPLLVEFVLNRALDTSLDDQGAVICDPACGGGAFLIAALDRLRACAPHMPRADLLNRVAGVDLDPQAAWIARVALWIWAQDPFCAFDRCAQRVVAGDALLGAAVPPEHDDGLAGTGQHMYNPRGSKEFSWLDAFPEVFGRDRPGFDAVVGNPPFLGQMTLDTARARTTAHAVRRASSGTVTRYADTAAAFWDLGTRLTRASGRVSLVLPLALMASRDAQPVRASVAQAGLLESLWTCDARVFADASVRVCVPTVRRHATKHASAHTVHRYEGPTFRPSGTVTLRTESLCDTPSWAGLLCCSSDAIASHGTEHLSDHAYDGPTLGAVAATSADFRDEYYALRGLVLEHSAPGGTPSTGSGSGSGTSELVPIITCGLIDPGEHHWGRATTRIHKQRWIAPAVSRAALTSDPVLLAYARKRLVPKLLVATQTRVIECIADADGRLLPSTPVLTVRPNDPSHLWLLLAALLSPVAASVALTRTKGSALSPDAIKLSAKQLAQLPLPGSPSEPSDTWLAAAHAIREASHGMAGTNSTELRTALEASGLAMIACYGITGARADGLFRWWRSRLPTRRTACDSGQVTDVGVIHHDRFAA